jgi:hypothetical protein
MIITETSTSIKYGNYKRYQKRAELIKEFVRLSQQYAGNEFDLMQQFRVRIRPIKGRVLGNCNKYGTIELDPRRKSFADMIITYCHELIHNEQFNTGRLVWDKGMRQWMGDTVNNKGTTYKAYRKQPWEIEAFDNQKLKAQRILKEMNKDKGLKKRLEQMEREWND